MYRYFVILTSLFALAACSGKPIEQVPTQAQLTETPTFREPLSISDLNRNETDFEKLIQAQTKAWNSKDIPSIKALLTSDSIFQDRTFGDLLVGPEAITGMLKPLAVESPNWESSTMEWFIGKDEGVMVSNQWNLDLVSFKFTRDHPLVEVDLLKTRQGLIYAWDLFYALKNFEDLHFVISKHLSEADSLLSSYQSAWSSGDAQAVAAMYAADAIREESILGERLQGKAAIESFAQSFFQSYPNTQAAISLEFGEGRVTDPMTGGIYTFKIRDRSGQPCDLRAAVLLETSNGQITYERVYYDAKTLINCGWAQ